MRTSFNDLKEIAYNINRQEFLLYNLKVSYRNGYYAVDAYTKKEEKMIYCMKSGMSCKECHEYLTGIRHAIFYIKPF